MNLISSNIFTTQKLMVPPKVTIERGGFFVDDVDSLKEGRTHQV